MVYDWKSNYNLSKVNVFFMFFQFVIRLDFNKEKLKKGRLKIEKLSALDIMVVENAINAISVSVLRHLFDKRLLTLTRGSYIFLTYTN